MLRRLHTMLVFALVAAFISMNVAQVVAASTLDQMPMTHGDHASMDRSDQNHDHRLVGETSKRDCLDYCLKTIDDTYLGKAPILLSAPELSTDDPVSVLKANMVTHKHTIHQMHAARGPPGYTHPQPVTGLRGLLLLNARLRN